MVSISHRLLQKMVQARWLPCACAQLDLAQIVVYRVQVVQHRPSSYPCSVSGHVSGRQTTPLHDAGPLAFAPIPPVRSLVQERSSGDLTESVQHTAQQLPAASAVFNSKGGWHWMFGHSTPAQGSFAPVRTWMELTDATSTTQSAKACMVRSF